MIRRASAGWDAGAEDRELVEGGDFWDGKRLGEEPPVSVCVSFDVRSLILCL
jgi:hypothetical protein